MNITEAITEIANKGKLISLGANIALQSPEGIEKYANEITEQCEEPGTNKQYLEKSYGKKVIKTILNFSKK